MLSGGSQFSSAVTKTSKIRHVRRDSLPRKSRCWSVRRTGGAVSGRLSHQAAMGEASQSASRGAATGNCAGRYRVRSKKRCAPPSTGARDRHRPERNAKAAIGAGGPFRPRRQNLPLQHFPPLRPHEHSHQRSFAQWQRRQVDVCLVREKDKRQRVLEKRTGQMLTRSRTAAMRKCGSSGMSVRLARSQRSVARCQERQAAETTLASTKRVALARRRWDSESSHGIPDSTSNIGRRSHEAPAKIIEDLPPR